MITHTHPIAGNLTIKTLVARRWPTLLIVIQCMHIGAGGGGGGRDQ